MRQSTSKATSTTIKARLAVLILSNFEHIAVRRQIESDGIERELADRRIVLQYGEQNPFSIQTLEDFQSLQIRIDQPHMFNSVPQIKGQLFGAIESGGAGGENFARPIRR